MATSDIFEKLKNLQIILVKKYEIEGKINEAPKQLNSSEELLARLKKEYIEKNSEYETVKSNVLKLKLELEEAVKSREAGEKGMDNITTHREYEALEKQINEATVRENDIRKDLQKEEKTLEEINETLKSNEELITSQENDLAENRERINKELEEYQNQLQDLEKDENEITPDLDQEILFKFQRIIQRNSEGIVAVKNGVCTGCHMILPAQFANTVREGENINFCPYCSRILFYEETTDEDSYDSYMNLNNLGSLVGLDDDDEDMDDEDSEEKMFDEDSEEKMFDEDSEDEDEESDDENEDADNDEASDDDED